MSREALRDDAPAVIISTEKLGFGLCHNCIYLWLTDMFFFYSGLQKEKLLVGLVLADPLPQWERERGNFAPSPPWPPSPASLVGKAGQVQEGGQRPAQDSAGSEPGCFQRGAWSWHCSAYWAGERDFLGSVCCKTERHREGLAWNWDGGKDHLCKDPLDWEEICVQNFSFFFFNSKADLSSSTLSAHCSALVFSETLLRGSGLLVVQVLLT